MPRTQTTLVYKFDELSDRAKEKARDWWREHVFHDSCDWEHVYTDAETIAALMGIEIGQRSFETVGGKTRSEPAISFSGFSSQGDGASFEGCYYFKPHALRAIKKHAPQDAKLHSIAQRLTDAQKAAKRQIAFKITTRGNYSHSGSMEFDLLAWDKPGEKYLKLDAITSEAEKDARDAIRSFADWIYRQLEAEYEWQMADEQVDDSITANEYEFTEDGARA